MLSVACSVSIQTVAIVMFILGALGYNLVHSCTLDTSRSLENMKVFVQVVVVMGGICVF